MEKASIQDIPHLFDLFIGGHWQPGTGGQTMLMIEPSTGTPIGTIACGTANDIDLAVCKARETFELRSAQVPNAGALVEVEKAPE